MRRRKAMAHRLPSPQDAIRHELIRGHALPGRHVAAPSTQKGEHRLRGPHQDEARVHVAASGAERLAHEAEVDPTIVFHPGEVPEEETVRAQRHDIEVCQKERGILCCRGPLSGQRAGHPQNSISLCCRAFGIFYAWIRDSMGVHNQRV